MKVRLTRAAYTALSEHARLPGAFDRWLQDGKVVQEDNDTFSVDLGRDTLARIHAHAVPGETVSETLLRAFHSARRN